MKIIIIGGVAGGASCAARLRRLDEKAQIIMVGTWALCLVRELRAALPCRECHRKGIQSADRLGANVQSDVWIDCRTNCEAIAIDAKEKTVELRE